MLKCVKTTCCIADARRRRVTNSFFALNFGNRKERNSVPIVSLLGGEVRARALVCYRFRVLFPRFDCDLCLEIHLIGI